MKKQQDYQGDPKSNNPTQGCVKGVTRMEHYQHSAITYSPPPSPRHEGWVTWKEAHPRISQGEIVPRG